MKTRTTLTHQTFPVHPCETAETGNPSNDWGYRVSLRSAQRKQLDTTEFTETQSSNFSVGFAIFDNKIHHGVHLVRVE